MLATDGGRLFDCIVRPVCLIAVLIASSDSNAAYMVFDGNVPQTDELVTLSGDATGLTLQGATTPSNTAVDIASTSQFLGDSNAGPAQIEARAANDINASQVAIDDPITISLANPDLRFSSLIFNAFNGGNVGVGGSLTLNIMGVNADNTPANATFTLDDDNDPLTVANGGNIFTVVATGGMLITSVEIVPNGATTYADLRQIRIAVVPEPSAWLLSAGTAMASIIASSRLRLRRVSTPFGTST